MHGGLSPEVTSLDVISNIDRPCEPRDKGLLMDLLWSDPTNKGEAWYHSIRGVSYMFGKAVVQQACQTLGIDLIIRAHVVVQDQSLMEKIDESDEPLQRSGDWKTSANHDMFQ